MRKISIGFLLATFVLASCKKGEYLLYNVPDNIHFNFVVPTVDSIVYTFAFTPGRVTDTVYVPMQLSGIRVNRDRQYAVAVTDSNTTAIVSEHYAPLQLYYVLPADSGTTYLPIIIYNTDTLLRKRSVALSLHLVATNDLGIAIADQDMGKVIISNKLEEPAWWTMWMGQYFSSTKYQLFIITTGLSTLSTSGLDAPKNLYYVSLLNSLLQDPFGWVAANPKSGYVLTQQPDGSYSFYNTDNPQSAIPLVQDASTGNWYFIDENGAEVM
ncbi:MAG TPA: DUF4843 domain-containing protein [Puia sp.]|nr:DUF4843 domain-containing protein [Puia sp.]